MSEAHPITFRLKVFNAWRRGNDAPQPDPKTVGEDIDSICDIAKRLERERDDARVLLAKYIPGDGCECEAHNESECGCGVDWTPKRQKELEAEVAEQARLLGMSSEREAALHGELERLKQLVRQYLHATMSVPKRAVDCDQEKVFDLEDKLRAIVSPMCKI